MLQIQMTSEIEYSSFNNCGVLTEAWGERLNTQHKYILLFRKAIVGLTVFSYSGVLALIYHLHVKPMTKPSASADAFNYLIV